MSAWLAKGSCTIMASRTTGGNAGVVHAGAALKAGRALMAGFTRSGRLDVRDRLGFYISIVTAVAGRTTTGDAGVVHRRRFERSRALMASLTGRCRWNVGAWFT